MSDSFVKDPMDAVKVGDVLEFRIISLDTERRRIGLSRKSEGKPGGGTSGSGGPRGGPSRDGATKTGDGKPKAVVVKREGKPQFEPRESRGGNRDDDGTMYNPFAAAFKKPERK